METTSEDFEFAALNEAVNYRRSLLQEFGPFLQGSVLEVGSGIGQLTEQIVRLPGVQGVHAVDPDARFFELLSASGLLIESTLEMVSDLNSEDRYDALVSVNVLEHIEDHADELRRYLNKLNRGGHLCLFVPAFPLICAPIDRSFGHYPRYTPGKLCQLLEEAGFSVQRISYYSSVGFLAWWLNFCVLKKMNFEIRKVRFYDRVISPLVHAWEYRVLRPFIGQSLLAMARA